jgi:hypothetical protein
MNVDNMFSNTIYVFFLKRTSVFPVYWTTMWTREFGFIGLKKKSTNERTREDSTHTKPDSDNTTHNRQ